MGYVDLETKNARYRLYFGWHLSKVHKPSNLENADAIVLEDVSLEPDLVRLDGHKGVEQKVFTDGAKRLGKPIYIVDSPVSDKAVGITVAKGVATATLGASGASAILFAKIGAEKGKISRRRFIGQTSGGLLALLGSGFLQTLDGFVNDFGGKIRGVRESIRRSAAFRRRAIPTPIVRGRDAIAAAKLNEVVAPQLMSKLGRKPSIVLVYGGAHSGLVEALRDENYKSFGARRAAQPKYLIDAGRILRFEWDPQKGEWEKERFEDRHVLERLRQGKRPRAPRISRRDFFRTLAGRRRHRRG